MWKGVKISKYKRNRVPMSLNSTLLFEDEVKTVLQDICADMKPSRRTLNTILQYAATYENVNTKIGAVDLMLN